MTTRSNLDHQAWLDQVRELGDALCTTIGSYQVLRPHVCGSVIYMIRTAINFLDEEKR